jgi:hypothetical protein
MRIMDTLFCLVITLKTPGGTENIAHFHLGTDRKKAIAIFQKLKGTTEINENNVLSIEFRETKEDLPVNLKMISCTLEQIAENCRLVTKELFKNYNVRI